MAGEITFHPERGDYVAVAKGSFRRGIARARFRWRILLLLAVGLGLGAAVSWLDTGEVSGSALVLGLGAAAGWLLIVLGGVYLLIPRRASRLFRQQRSLSRAFTLRWDERGLSQQWDNGSVFTPWADYHDWFETERVLAFGLNERLYHFVPTRAITETDRADLRATVRAIVGPNAHA